MSSVVCDPKRRPRAAVPPTTEQVVAKSSFVVHPYWVVTILFVHRWRWLLPRWLRPLERRLMAWIQRRWFRIDTRTRVRWGGRHCPCTYPWNADEIRRACYHRSSN